MNQLENYGFDHGYQFSLDKLSLSDSQRIERAIKKYQQAPETPGLNLEKLQGNPGKKRLWTIRASQELRVLLVREGPTSIFIRAGHHDAIYRFADQWTWTSGRPHDGIPGLVAIKSDAVDLDGSTLMSGPAALAWKADSERSILEHWDTSNLVKAGFDKKAIERLRHATRDTLPDVWPDIDNATLDQVMECLEQSPDEFFQRQLIADDTRRYERFREAIVERGALGGLSTLLTSEEFRLQTYRTLLQVSEPQGCRRPPQRLYQGRNVPSCQRPGVQGCISVWDIREIFPRAVPPR